MLPAFFILPCTGSIMMSSTSLRHKAQLQLRNCQQHILLLSAAKPNRSQSHWTAPLAPWAPLAPIGTVYMDAPPSLLTDRACIAAACHTSTSYHLPKQLAIYHADTPTTCTVLFSGTLQHQGQLSFSGFVPYNTPALRQCSQYPVTQNAHPHLFADMP
jgi:hypothetical protein